MQLFFLLPCCIYSFPCSLCSTRVPAGVICALVATFSPLTAPWDCPSGDLNDAGANWFLPSLSFSLSPLWIPDKSSHSIKSHVRQSMRPGSEIVSSGWDLGRASLPAPHDVTYKATIGPRGVFEPSYDLRKAMVMNCAHPSLQSSVLHPSIISSDSHMWVHLPAYLWGWACRPEVLSAPQGSEQRSLHRRWRCRTGWLPLCQKRQ